LPKINYVEIDTIITINRRIIELWNKRHSDKPEFLDVGIDRIEEVLDKVKSVANDLEFENMLIEKAAYLVGGLAWSQAFSGGNKRTAILTCTVFLLQNGYRLNIPQNKNPELRQLLFDIQEERGEIRREIIVKIILYIRKYLSKA